MLVGGCWADGLAADGVPLAAPAVGMPQGPEVAELTPSAKSIILARMNAIVFIALQDSRGQGRDVLLSEWGFLCNPAPDAVFHAKGRFLRAAPCYEWAALFFSIR